MGSAPAVAQQAVDTKNKKEIVEHSLVQYASCSPKNPPQSSSDLDEQLGDLKYTPKYNVTLEQFSPICKTDMIFPSDEHGKGFGREGGEYFVEKMDDMGKEIVIRHHWNDLSEMHKYISNMVKLENLCGVKVYHELIVSAEQAPYVSECLIKENNPILPIDKSKFYRRDLIQQVDLLIFVAKTLSRCANMWIEPEFIYYTEDSSNLILINFRITNKSPLSIFLGFLAWIFTSIDSFEECLQDLTIIETYDLPVHIKALLSDITKDVQLQLQVKDIHDYLQRIREKILIMSTNVDSFHACIIYNKLEINEYTSKEWLLAKKQNVILFFNVNDLHCSKGKIIRKSRKIDIEDRTIIFNKDQLSVKLILENTKFAVQATQFSLQEYSSISDIEIVHKFPMKMHNPMMFASPQGDIYILDQVVYKYSPRENKIVQETKKIIDYIFLTPSKDFQYMVVRQSIDIFRNGIRVILKGYQEVELLLTGNSTVLNQISSIRVDLRSVEFCFQVYRGVFLMLAARNFWILDLNFNCFFSYATLSNIKEFYGFSKSSGNNSGYAFEVMNQNFNVQFLKDHSGINVSLEGQILLILGKIMGKIYFLKYKFEPKLGALRLISYKPIFAQCDTITALPKKENKQFVDYQFNFHQQNANFYRYSDWIFKGPDLLDVKDFNIGWSKNSYQVSLQIQRVEGSLKEALQQMKKQKEQLTKEETLMLLHRVMTIYRYLVQNQITHKTFSVSNLYFTVEKQLKLIGWSEPPRNWYISDFKDYLLVCFNIITYNSVEKINDKLLTKHQRQLSQFPAIQQAISTSYKYSKTVEKKPEVDKGLTAVREYLEKEISNLLSESNQAVQSKCIFSFQYNTPRFNMVHIETQKIKKISIEFENQADQITFKDTDKYAWNEEQGSLYVFSNASYKFFEVKIDANNTKEEKIKVEDYEYLPMNTGQSAIAFVPGKGLYSFGGIAKQKNGKQIFCTDVYLFNWQKLTWEVDGQICEPRVNAQAVLSCCKSYVYLVGGQVDKDYDHFMVICYDLISKKSYQMIDKTILNPLASLTYENPLQIFHISTVYNIFLFWYMNGGNFNVRFVSSIKSGFDITIQSKHYMEEKQCLSSLSVTIQGKYIHLLRPYGKYTKITVQKFQSLQCHSQTLYAV